MNVKPTKIRRDGSRQEWNKVKERIKDKGKQADRRKCKLDRGLTINVGLQ